MFVFWGRLAPTLLQLASSDLSRQSFRLSHLSLVVPPSKILRIETSWWDQCRRRQSRWTPQSCRSLKKKIYKPWEFKVLNFIQAKVSQGKATWVRGRQFGLECCKQSLHSLATHAFLQRAFLWAPTWCDNFLQSWWCGIDDVPITIVETSEYETADILGLFATEIFHW